MARQEKVNLSIHPRNWYLVDKTWKPGNVSNTSKSAQKGKEKLAAHDRHTSEHPEDTASQQHLAMRKAVRL